MSYNAQLLENYLKTFQQFCVRESFSNKETSLAVTVALLGPLLGLPLH